MVPVTALRSNCAAAGRGATTRTASVAIATWIQVEHRRMGDMNLSLKSGNCVQTCRLGGRGCNMLASNDSTKTIQRNRADLLLDANEIGPRREASVGPRA